MNKKIFENACFCPKGDIEANWNKAVGFIPLDKEIIIYKPDDSHSAARFKIGDGKTVVQDLPFSGANIDEIQQLINEKGEFLIEYIDNAVAAIEIPEVDQIYDSESENAQSGLAVAEAIQPLEEKMEDFDEVATNILTEEEADSLF